MLVIRGLLHQYWPQRRSESTLQWFARRYPHLGPPAQSYYDD